jgi:thioredoxin reductase (NADPH)
MPGVFAVGDVRYRSIKRVASAAGDGATAVRMIHEYLAAELTGPPVRINEARADTPATAPP